jgi:hypothetical protein
MFQQGLASGSGPGDREDGVPLPFRVLQKDLADIWAINLVSGNFHSLFFPC